MDSAIIGDIAVTLAVVAFYLLSNRKCKSSKPMATRKFKHKYKVMSGQDVTKEYL